MNHGSLFSGIGGFDLAAEWMGWDNVFHCEIESFPRKVLQYYWPKAISYEDIKKTDFTIHRGKIDILTGGFPCQPFSLAGKRKGTEDDRNLWPEMLRAIREIAPKWVVGENVFGITNWNGGLVFEQVQADLEAEGYEIQPYILPACGVNAPHRRDRIWFVAYRSNNASTLSVQQRGQNKTENINFGRKNEGRDVANPKSLRKHREEKPENCCEQSGKQRGCDSDNPGEIRQRNGDKVTTNPGSQGLEGGIRPRKPIRSKSRSKEIITNPSNKGLQGRKLNETFDKEGQIRREQSSGSATKLHQITDWQNFPTQPPVRSVYNGVPSAMVRNIKEEIYGQISERYTDKDLQEVREAFQSQEIREQIGRLYKIHEPGVLLQTVQLCTASNTIQKGISVFSEETSEGILRKMRKYGKLADSPQGRKLEKQFKKQFADTLPYLSHEIALVTMETERAAKKHLSQHRNESIKAYGNAIVPQVVYEIFKSIGKYESLGLTQK